MSRDHCQIEHELAALLPNCNVGNRHDPRQRLVSNVPTFGGREEKEKEPFLFSLPLGTKQTRNCRCSTQEVGPIAGLVVSRGKVEQTHSELFLRPSRGFITSTLDEHQ